MKNMKKSWLWVGLLAMAGLPLGAAEPRVVFEDRFDGKLGEGWTWLRENPAAWRIHGHGLEIRVEPGVAATVKNALLRGAPARSQRKYAIEVTITFTRPPTKQFEQAGITWYQGGKAVFKLVHENVDRVLYIIPGRAPAPENTVELRLVVGRDSFSAQYRPEGKGEFKTAAAGRLPPGDDEQVSLQCYQGPEQAEHWMRFANFRIVELAE
jgi:hypothetical protein